MNMAQRPRVLIIDDELVVSTAVSSMLEMYDFDVDYALSPEEGFTCLDEHPGIDIILLDIDLGTTLSGIDVLSLIKQKHKYIQVMMFTSQEALSTALECMKKGAFDYLIKPFELESFMSRVPAALEKKNLLQISDLYFDMIIHDLKNPLQCIIGAHDCLREYFDVPKDSIQKKLFETADNGIQQIQMMIGNILSIARFENGTFSPRMEMFSLCDYIQKSLEVFGPFASLDIRYLPDVAHCYGDKELFSKVLTNVVSNAIRFSLPQHKIVITIEVVNKFIQLRVTNNGSFIPETMRELVFDKFAGVHRGNAAIRGQNFGLGLTFCKMAIEAMGGAIWVDGDESLPETSFVFTIPLGRDAMVAMPMTGNGLSASHPP